MVATTLLATVTAGAVTAFTRAHAARRDAGQLQQLHERAQYVFASFEPELQMAGYFATAIAPAPLAEANIPEPAQRCGIDLVRRVDLPIQIEPTWTLPCAPRGDGAVTGSDVMVVRRASSRAVNAPEVGRAQWLSRLADLHEGHLYWQGDAPWPPGTPGQELRELIVRVYYVARSSDGDIPIPALRMKSLTSIAGVPAFIDTEVMPGVEQLQVEVLPSPAAPRAVRVHLRVRTDSARVRSASVPRALDVSRYFLLRNDAS